jgi:hypothetical protein
MITPPTQRGDAFGTGGMSVMSTFNRDRHGALMLDVQGLSVTLAADEVSRGEYAELGRGARGMAA